MDLEGWGILIMVSVALWTFIPRHIRHALRSGLAPAVVVLSETVLDVVSVAGKALTHVAYRGLLGVPVPPDVIVKSEEVEEEELEIAPPATTLQNNNNGVAMPATDNNDLLLAEKLAIMVREGKIGETAGIKLFFGVSPSSTSPRYIAARAALKAAQAKLNNPYPRMTPEQQRVRDVLGLGKR